MLILSRKGRQQIFIGDDIAVTVLRIAGNRVCVGIDAPDSMRIVRGELKTIVEEANAELNGEVVELKPGFNERAS